LTCLSKMANILIVDDELNIRNSLKSALTRRGHTVELAKNYKEGDKYSKETYDVIFLDVLLPDGNGLDLLKAILTRNVRQLVVMISGHADVEMAVEAIRAGAYDFIEKPISLERVLVTLENATQKIKLVSEKERLDSIIYGDFIGQSEPVVELKNNITRSAPKANRFLIQGENGTGKEMIANMIHRRGRNSSGPFVAVNCAALPHDLIESELFGHVAGAFTGAAKNRRGRFLEADGGSIFLDEIGEMSAPAQAKILRVIENSEITPVGADKSMPINCIIIAASNKDLNGLAERGKFRQDLLFRLNVIQFNVPPLRERREDIPLLADYFLGRFADEIRSTPKKLSADARSFLRKYEFPGNVRELKNLMERINIYCEGTTVNSKDIKPLLPGVSPKSTIALKKAVDNFEKRHIESALAANNGNVAQTARQLGLERSHLYKKMKRLKIK
jgi:DNA-binding NtrC family response regulator